LTSFTVKAGESVSKGDMCKVTSGEAELALSTSTTVFGVAANDADEEETVKLYPPDSVYGVVDPVARNCGDVLDINGGGDGVATKLNDDLTVVRNSSSTEDTLVMLHDNAKIFSNAT